MIARLMMRAGLLLAPMVAIGVAHAQDAPPQPAPEAQKPATSGNYFSLTGGYFAETDFSYDVGGIPIETEIDGGYGIEGAWGHAFGNGWRGEIALGWRDHGEAISTFGTGSGVSALTLDAIAFYDFAPGAAVNFYVGAGIGVAGINIDDGVIDDSTGSAAHVQGIAGLEVKVSDTMKLFGEARLGSLIGKIEDSLGGDSDFDITSGSVHGGLKFLF